MTDNRQADTLGSEDYLLKSTTADKSIGCSVGNIVQGLKCHLCMKRMHEKLKKCVHEHSVFVSKKVRICVLSNLFVCVFL